MRQRYKLPAYTHRVHYDYTGEVEGRGLDEFGGKRIMRYNRNTAVDEIAVLVGDFPTVDDVERMHAREAQVRQAGVLERRRRSEPSAGRIRAKCSVWYKNASATRKKIAGRYVPS